MEMLPRVRWQTRVSDALTLMAHLIKARSRVGMNDASVVLEAIVRNVLNETFDWDLQNLNTGGPNYPAVDLGDKARREAVQVTVQDSGTKISDTVKGAIDHAIAREYNRLTIFFLLPKKPSWPRSLERPGDIMIETMDIADLTQLVGQIENIAKLERVANIVENEVGRNVELYRQANITPQPKLRARFLEASDDGLLCEEFEDESGARVTTYYMSIWVEDAPTETERVIYDVLHESFVDSPWTIDRAEDVVLDFEDDEFSSYGDVDIWLRGIGKGMRDWRLSTTLYEALVNHYSAKPSDSEIARAMREIRDN